jgi:FMN phosphatase YigB (HAD superfamily)
VLTVGTAPCFLFDVDNTLIDNDRFAVELAARLDADFGAGERRRYWKIFEQRRSELGYADYLGALEMFREGAGDHPRLLGMSDYLLDFPFPSLLYPQALEALAHAATLGTVGVLSDGDIVFQPRKIRRAGIWDAVDGRVLIYVHKERSLENMQQSLPASRYIVVDDKANLLAAMKRILGARLTTVFVRQGHYAHAASGESAQPAADLTIDRIGDFLSRPLSDFEVTS